MNVTVTVTMTVTVRELHVLTTEPISHAKFILPTSLSENSSDFETLFNSALVAHT